MDRKNIAILASLLAIFAILAGCSGINDNSSADWAFSFVVWDDHIYQISDEFVPEVDKEIGEVTAYSDLEGSYSGNFSNVHEVGTKFYSITGIGTEEAIAIEESDGNYRKALRTGEYEGN